MTLTPKQRANLITVAAWLIACAILVVLGLIGGFIEGRP